MAGERRILYRVLTGPEGDTLLRLARADSVLDRTGKVTQWMLQVGHQHNSQRLPQATAAGRRPPTDGSEGGQPVPDRRGRRLGQAWLQYANLSSANLKRAFLRGAQIQHAWLVDAQLEDADLIDAQLEEANLGRAQLRKADLRMAQLRGAHLRNEDLTSASLAAAALFTVAMAPARAMYLIAEGSRSGFRRPSVAGVTEPSTACTRAW